MMEHLINYIKSIPAVLKLIEFSEKRFPEKQKIKILEPCDERLYLNSGENSANKTISGEIQHYKAGSVVWLLSLSENGNKHNPPNTIFPQNGSPIIPNLRDGRWQGSVFFTKHDKLQIYAVVIPKNSTLDLLFQYYFKAQKHYYEQFRDDKKPEPSFLGFDSDILNKCDLIELVAKFP